MQKIEKHGLGVCSKCPSRVLCRDLCSEAEAIADQDYVPLKEVPIGLPTYQDVEFLLISNIYLTKTERQILTLLGRGLSRQEVCEILEITRNSLRFHLHNIRKKS